jgi:hypothetical protein
MTPSTLSPIYVGYRPLPTQMRRSLLVLVPGIAVVLVLIAGVLALSQRNAGDGVWDATLTTYQGTLLAQPIPALLVISPEGVPAVMLLAEEGKHGAQERVNALQGMRATVRGTSLMRGELRMVEIQKVSAVDDAASTTCEAVWQQETRAWRGEIVDAKCYLGAMKPGDGKAHKACATLCVRNGIPALFVTNNEARVIMSAVDASILQFIGEPVEVTGTEGMWAGLPVVRIESVKRLGVLK